MFWTKVILVGLLATAADGSCTPQTTSYPLVAGQHHNVGSVHVTPTADCSDFNVEYSTQDGWCMKETHLQVNNLHEVTNKKGNPKVGHFENGDSYDPCVTSATFGPFDCGADGNVPIAAHAVVDAAKITLPPPTTQGSVEIQVFGVPGTTFEDTTFWDVEIDFLDVKEPVFFDAWCIDRRTFLSNRERGCANLYADYDTLPGYLKECVEGYIHLDQVNYIINNFSHGDSEPSCGGPYDYKDIQGAIWELVEPDLSPQGRQCYRDEILDAAAMYGIGFEPNCYQLRAVVIEPFDCDAGQPTNCNVGYPLIKQIIFAEMLVCAIDHSCDCEETGWGKDNNSVQFSDTNGWAAYNEYTCDCDCGARERHLRAA